MKIKKISTKLLSVLLPVILAAMTVLTFISYSSSKSTFQKIISSNMETKLQSEVNAIQLKIDKVSTIATQIAKTVEVTYKDAQLSDYEEILKKDIFESDLIMGSGIWFEPYEYNANEKYVGPYIVKDGSTAKTTYEYSNAEYDYFKYDWYKNALGGNRAAVISTPYFDETSNSTMSSCTVPMYNSDNKFIGVVTVDINITSIQQLISDLQIGETGKATLLTGDGYYITNQDDPTKILKMKITEDENKSVADLGKQILENEKGIGTYKHNGDTSHSHFTTLDNLGWKLVISMPENEMNAPLMALLNKLIIVSVLAIVVTIIVIVVQVRNLTNNIKKVHEFALTLAKGDFSIDNLDIKSEDELGQMSNALNDMLQENKTIISNIANDSNKVNNTSEKLQDATVRLAENYEKIEEAIKVINGDMMSSSAATEEVNASIEEVNASVSYLVQEANKGLSMSNDIKDRASEIEKASTKSYEKAGSLVTEYEENLNKSIEYAKVVKSIGAMAETISEIAKQVNLLSLNAAIEAARAGEQGKGFAVVANEIRNLASETTSAVEEIKETVDKVQGAFDNLTRDSKQMLQFVNGTVEPDYEMFVGVAKQYGDDANTIEMISTKIATMTDSIEKIISEVGEAIQSIAISAQNTAENGGTISCNIDSLSTVVKDVEILVSNEKEVSSDLSNMVKKFKL